HRLAGCLLPPHEPAGNGPITDKRFSEILSAWSGSESCFILVFGNITYNCMKMYGGALPLHDPTTNAPYRVVHLERCVVLCFNIPQRRTVLSPWSGAVSCVLTVYGNITYNCMKMYGGSLPLHDLSTTEPYRVVHLERVRLPPRQTMSSTWSGAVSCVLTVYGNITFNCMKMSGSSLPLHDLSTTAPYRVVHLERCVSCVLTVCGNTTYNCIKMSGGPFPLHALSTTAPYYVVH
ncbi:hypothetical protein J6590_105551, partial [Homalodisca vitripennis]